MQDKQAIIFDLDGTIVDSLGMWSEVDVLLARALGAQEVDRAQLSALRERCLERYHDDAQPYARYCGELARMVGSSLSDTQAHALRYKISRQLVREKVRLREGAARVLRALHDKQVRLAVATTTKRANVDIYCDSNASIRREIELRTVMEFFVTFEDVTRIKPDGECYARALERLGLVAHQALVIEDSCVGVRAAHAAGLEAIAIAEPHSARDAAWLRANTLAYCDNWQQLGELLLG